MPIALNMVHIKASHIIIFFLSHAKLLLGLIIAPFTKRIIVIPIIIQVIVNVVQSLGLKQEMAIALPLIKQKYRITKTLMLLTINFKTVFNNVIINNLLKVKFFVVL